MPDYCECRWHGPASNGSQSDVGWHVVDHGRAENADPEAACGEGDHGIAGTRFACDVGGKAVAAECVIERGSDAGSCGEADEEMMGEAFDGQGSGAIEVVSAWDECGEFFADDVDDGQVVWGAAGIADECEIDRAGTDSFDQVVGVALGQRDGDARMQAVELGEAREPGCDVAPGNHRDTKFAADELERLADRALDGRRGGESSSSGGECRRPGDGRADRPGGPIEKLRTEFAFQLSDLGADARLTDVHDLGRVGEALLLNNGDEVLQLPEFHDHRF